MIESNLLFASAVSCKWVVMARATTESTVIRIPILVINYHIARTPSHAEK